MGRKSKKIVKVRHGPRPCWLCGTLNGDWSGKYVHRHHIFSGSNRAKSEEYGLTVDLCVEHHEYGQNAVHTNRETELLVKRYGQALFEQEYSREKFMQEFGKNYL